MRKRHVTVGLGLSLVGVLIGALAAIAPASAAPLELYSHLPSLEEVRISPDGTRLALVRQASFGRVAAVIDLTTQKPVSVLKLNTAKQRDLQWGDNNHLLVTYSSTGYAYGVESSKQEWFQTISFDVLTKHQSMLLDGEAGSEADYMNVTDGAPMVRTVNGKSLVFVVGTSFVEQQGVRTLFQVDLNNGRTKVVQQGSPNTIGWRVLSDGKTLIRTDYDDKSGVWSVWIKLPDHTFQKRYSVKELIDYPEIEGVDEAAHELILSMGDQHDKQSGASLYRLSMTGTDAPVLWRDHRFDSLISDPASHSVIGGSDDGMTENLQFFSPHDQAQWQVIVKAYGEEKIQLESWSADRRIIIVQLDGPQSGAAFGMINLNTGKADWIGDRYDGLGPDDLGVVRQIAYKAADGLEIPALLTLPVGVKADPPPKNLPLIVLPHGGPAAHDKEEFDYFAQSLASQGYAVLQPQFRGSTGFGVDLWQAGFGQWGKKMQTDLSDGVRYLAKLGLIDPKRVAIMGGSYGGYAALAGAAFDGPVYRCAVSIAGISDPQRMVKWEAEQMGGADTSTVRYWDRFMGATKPSDPSFSEIAPIKHIDAIHIPILLIHGKDDTVVDFSQSQKMYEALKAAGKPVDLVTLKAEDHWLSRDATRLQALQSAVTFLQTCNPPDPPVHQAASH